MRREIGLFPLIPSPLVYTTPFFATSVQTKQLKLNLVELIVYILVPVGKFKLGSSNCCLSDVDEFLQIPRL